MSDAFCFERFFLSRISVVPERVDTMIDAKMCLLRTNFQQNYFVESIIYFYVYYTRIYRDTGLFTSSGCCPESARIG